MSSIQRCLVARVEAGPAIARLPNCPLASCDEFVGLDGRPLPLCRQAAPLLHLSLSPCRAAWDKCKYDDDDYRNGTLNCDGAIAGDVNVTLPLSLMLL